MTKHHLKASNHRPLMALSSLARSVIIGQWSDVIDHWSVVCSGSTSIGGQRQVHWHAMSFFLGQWWQQICTAKNSITVPWSQPGDFHYLFVKLAFAICIPGQPH